MNFTEITSPETADQFLLDSHKHSLKIDLELTANCIDICMQRVKGIISKKNLVSAMPADEHLDLMLLYKELEVMKDKITKQKGEL